MKVLLYSDLHISKTSSILPLFIDGSKYSYRQQMIINTGKYLANLVRQYKPDMIINLGDTFDVHTLTSYDISTASEFFKCFEEFTDIKHYVLVGNHEMVNQNFNAVELLNNIDNITVISDPRTLCDGELAFLPYCNYNDITEFPTGKFLFSHQDIQGSQIRGDIQLPDGISSDFLQKTYKLVFNGHIHKPSIFKNIINVGSVTTHSFADDNDSVPQCYLFDTETLNLEVFKPKVCLLFRKITVDTLDDLVQKLNELDDSYKYIISCTCPYDIKEEVKNMLTSDEKIVNSRLNVLTCNGQKSLDNSEIIIQQSSIDIIKSFEEFLNTVDLKYAKQMYLDILEEVEVK